MPVLPRSAPEITRQSQRAKFRFPDHEMERPKRGLSAFRGRQEGFAARGKERDGSSGQAEASWPVVAKGWARQDASATARPGRHAETAPGLPRIAALPACEVLETPIRPTQFGAKQREGASR